MTNLDKQRDHLANEYWNHKMNCGHRVDISMVHAFQAGFNSCAEILNERIEKLESALEKCIEQRDYANDCLADEIGESHRERKHLKQHWKKEEDSELEQILGSGEHE